MPRTGPPPKPTVLKLVEGNRGKRSLNKKEPKPPVNLGPPPSFLCAEAKKEWKKIGQILFTAGVITDFDHTAFAAYCQSYADWVLLKKEIKEQVKREGVAALVSTTKTGYTMENMKVTTARKMEKQLKDWLIEFGMTPAARSRVTTEKNQTGNEFDDL